MPKLYDKKKIHRLFLRYQGNIGEIMKHNNMPVSRKTIRRYAENNGWYDELPNNNEDIGNTDIDRSLDKIDTYDIENLEKIRSDLYKYITSTENQTGIELKPKTYTEAIKCYLDIDSRIDERKSKINNSESGSWEKIIKRCIISSN
ncbi:TPA: hypothetical protein ENS27_16440 [bacterium]|nr:hypothetical protein [bacterium]